jgi:hypothetical protein
MNVSQNLNLDNRLLAKLLINICTLLSVSFAIIVSLIIIVYIFLIYISRNQYKNSFNVSLLLTCNTCLAIICSSTILILIQLSSISGDRHIVSLKWIIFWGCHTRGYLLFLFINSIYLSYVLQAGYRLCCIVFHKYRCLRTFSTFFYYILGQWILSFIVLIPILFAGENLTTSIVYLPDDFYCQVPITSMPSILYLVFAVYISPLCIMCIIYFWIIIYMRCNMRYKQSASTMKIQHQNNRDTIVFKRICIVMISLLILGIPSFIFFIVCIINGHLHWAFYRLTWMTVSVSYAFICLSSIYVTPQIYSRIRIMFSYFKPHRKNSQVPTSIANITETRTKTKHSILHRMSSADMIEMDLIERTTSHT